MFGGGFMAFKAEGKEELVKSLDEVRRLIFEREKSLKERAAFAVKIRDYTAEAIYVLTSELLELEKLIVMYMAAKSNVTK
jgi:adenylate kinase